jgi:hypothetical protein
MNAYRLGKITVESNDAQLPDLLAGMHKEKRRPLCLCRDPGVEMYIAKIEGRYYLKRMPNTGGDHDASCDSYEPPPELSGLGQVAGTAIVEDPDQGTTSLKLDFSLSKGSARKAPEPSGVEADSVRTDGNKLTLRGMLHYLWGEAGFHKWSPSMAGKRSWGTIRKFLMQAAENKIAKGTGISEILYIPEMFSTERKDAIAQRRNGLLMKIAGPKSGTRRLMLLVGEVKEIAPSRHGHKMVIKHLPDFQFMLNDQIHRRMLKRFNEELELSDAVGGARIVAIATFSVSQAGVAFIEEIALMVTTENWIPFENRNDEILLDVLTRSGRRFTKGLRYNLATTRPIACASLSDTAEPIALFIVPVSANEEYVAELNSMIEESKVKPWVWRVDQAEMPELPR